MQSEHAWLIDGNATPRIVDTLQWTTDRAHAGVVFDPAAVSIGIPLPVGELHDESDWQLVHGAKTLALGQVKKLRSSEVQLVTVRAYTPPFQTPASQREWSGRFVWFDVAERFEARM
jgi:hypothetical protein